MNASSHPPFRPFLTAAIDLFVLGLGLLAIAIFAFEPNVWARWLFFFGGTLTLSGLALPATWFLNLRFPSTPPAGVHVIVRQAIWVGVFGGLLAWFQQERLASFGMIVGLAIGLGAIEYLVRMRERSLWRPPDLPPEPDEKPAAAEPSGE